MTSSCCIQRAIKFRSIPVTVILHNKGVYDENGIWDAARENQATIYAVIQPATGVDLIRADESRRTRETLVLFTTGDINTADEVNKIQPDIVLYEDKRYEVESVMNWGSFRKAILVKMEQ